MAQRPVFVPLDRAPWVRQRTVEFKWHAGMAVSQKQKSIASLHAAARSHWQFARILEISTKSTQSEGVFASAFNLKIEMPSGTQTSLECAYQGSKRFVGGGPFTDLYRRTPLDAKRDERVKGSAGRLLAFEYFGETWPLDPPSLFYDWLYITALTQEHNASLLSKVREYDAFTDIEFNPEKSVSCQANSAAIAVALKKSSHDLKMLAALAKFHALMVGGSATPQEGQARLF
jgi:hypothetical protein